LDRFGVQEPLKTENINTKYQVVVLRERSFEIILVIAKETFFIILMVKITPF
jgi:hypothetical protein